CARLRLATTQLAPQSLVHLRHTQVEHIVRLQQAAAARQPSPVRAVYSPQLVPDAIEVESMVIALAHVDFVVTEQPAQQRATPGLQSRALREQPRLGLTARLAHFEVLLCRAAPRALDVAADQGQELFAIIAPARVDQILVRGAAVSMRMPEFMETRLE